jgi:RND family efflux transporter MFP subunit
MRRNLIGIAGVVLANAAGVALGIAPFIAAATVMAIGAVALVNFLVDPYRRFRKTKRTYYSRSRFLHAGLIRTEDYDTVVLGSSLIEYLKPSMVEQVLGGRCLKLCLRGMTALELGVVLGSVIAAGKARRIILALDPLTMRGETDRLPAGLVHRPWHLYRPGFTVGLRYLVNIETLRRSRSVLGRDAEGKDRRKFDPDLYGYPVKPRLWSRESVCGIWNAGDFERVTDPAEHAYEKLRASFDRNVAPVLRRETAAELWLYYPPYSIFAFVHDRAQGVFDAHQRLKAHVFDTVAGLGHIRLFDFQDDESITHDLDRFCDLVHYSPAVNLELLRRLAVGQGLVKDRERVLESRRRIEAQVEAILRGEEPRPPGHTGAGAPERSRSARADSPALLSALRGGAGEGSLRGKRPVPRVLAPRRRGASRRTPDSSGLDFLRTVPEHAMSLQGLQIDRHRKPRRRRRWPARLAWIVVAALLLLLLRQPLFRLYERFTLSEVRTVRVDAADPAAAGAIRGKAANGYVVAARRAALSADFAGRISEMLVREGSVVKRGDIVAKLDSEEQQAAARRAEADLAVAEDGVARAEADRTTLDAELDRMRRLQDSATAALASARTRLEQTARDLARAEELAAKGVSPQSEQDDALSAHRVAEADVRAADANLSAATAAIATGLARTATADVDIRIAKSRVAVAKAALEQAEAAREKTNVRAPFDGIVVLKDAEVGEVVSPFSQGGSNARGSVVTMVDFASLEVQANVPETSLDAVIAGAPAQIFVDAWPDRPYRGRVDRIWPTADRQKGTIEVRVVFLEPDDRLRPDLGARVVFLPEGTEPETPREPGIARILVPEDTIVVRDGGSAAFILEGDVVRLRPVRTGARRGGRVEIESGLAEGDRIVLGPPAGLADGDRVRIRE